jgi:hypothetical protein
MLLVAPPFNGKTSILERFMELHSVDLDVTAEVTTGAEVMQSWVACYTFISIAPRLARVRAT